VICRAQKYIGNAWNNNNNKCIGDDTKATARQSPNCIKKTKKHTWIQDSMLQDQDQDQDPWSQDQNQDLIEVEIASY